LKQGSVVQKKKDHMIQTQPKPDMERRLLTVRELAGVLANPSGHGLSADQGTEVARVPGGLRLAFQPPRDRTVDDPRTETKLICALRDRTATIA
jgi:hypothetical protein